MKLPFGYEIIRRKPLSQPRKKISQLKDESLDIKRTMVSGKPKHTRARRKYCKNGHRKTKANTIFVGSQWRCGTCYDASLERQKIVRRLQADLRADHQATAHFVGKTIENMTKGGRK